MNFSKLVPNIFYVDIKDGLKLFVEVLQFQIEHNDLSAKNPFCVVAKDGLRVNLFEDEKLAKEHHPEFRLVTHDIENVFAEISNSFPEYLHPNLKTVTKRPWGAKEFAILDNQLGIIFQEW